VKQESRAVARKPRDAAAVLFGLNFADNIHYNLKSSQASKAMLQSSKHTGAKQTDGRTAGRLDLRYSNTALALRTSRGKKNDKSKWSRRKVMGGEKVLPP